MRRPGLQQVDGEASTVALRARGTEHHVLSLVKGTGHSLKRLSLGGASAADVDEVADRVLRHGVELVSGPGQRQAPGGGYATQFRDPEGRLIEVSAEVAEHVTETARPFGLDRLSHIVLNSVDIPASKDFYTGLLGFQISDCYENDQMVFLRCNNLHHCIALAPGRWTSVNHVAFEVASADEVMKALGRLRKAGYDTI